MSAAKVISLPIQRCPGSGVLLCIDGSLLNTYGGLFRYFSYKRYKDGSKGQHQFRHINCL